MVSKVTVVLRLLCSSCRIPVEEPDRQTDRLTPQTEMAFAIRIKLDTRIVAISN